MNTVSGNNIKQLSAYQTYNVGSCGCGHCSSFTKRAKCSYTDNVKDWEFGSRSCCFTCSHQPKCSKPNPVRCDIGGGAQTSTVWDSVKKAPYLTCNFNLDKITSLKQVQNWKSKFGTGGDYDDVMKNYCKQITTQNCITNPYTDKPMKKCSLMFSKSDTECTEWFNKLKPQKRDGFIQQVCKEHEDLDECKCQNRERDPVYQTVSHTKEISDGCWWKPCKNTGSNLVPSNLLKPKCPSNLCETSINIDRAGHDVSIKNINNYITCGYKPKPTPNPKPTPRINLLYVGVGVAILVILLLLIVFRSNTKS